MLVFNNPKDPLLARTPEAGKDLMKKIVPIVKDYPFDAVGDVGLNLLINVVRQRSNTREKAARDWDALVARGKQILLDNHYDSRGRKKGIFPYDQVINMPLIKVDEKA
jgi:hypothetical protein